MSCEWEEEEKKMVWCEWEGRTERDNLVSTGRETGNFWELWLLLAWYLGT